jgi:murein DD-endopeptidase MepM/ murein hydrolase activator NlpD
MRTALLLAAAAGLVPSPPQVTRLTLPFDGIWGVLQGMASGDSHRGYAAYALDFVPAQPRWTKPPARGAPLSAFACYGQPVLAPADGKVVGAWGGARDWPAYTEGGDQGNYVFIEHARGEVTEFRHLAADSVTVALGQKVRRGEVIGRCGNSGNARMPHLHIALLSSVSPIRTRAVVFSDYEVVGADNQWHDGTGTLLENEIVRRKR